MIKANNILLLSVVFSHLSVSTKEEESTSVESCTENCDLFGTINDGGFEEGFYGPWDHFSQAFGTPYCNPQRCSDSARSGDWWIWFGGIDQEVEDAYVEQEILLNDEHINGDYVVVILEFWISIESRGARGELKVFIDEKLVWEVTQAEALSYPSWTKVKLDISHFASDTSGCSVLRFETQTRSFRGGDFLNFFLDDVSISTEFCHNQACWTDMEGNTCENYSHESCGDSKNGAQKACCVCGGGSALCKDVLNWISADGLTCCDFAQHFELCQQNVAAQVACCACGGGAAVTDPPTIAPAPDDTAAPTPVSSKAPTSSPTTVPTNPPTPEPVPQYCCLSSTFEVNCKNPHCCSTGEWVCDDDSVSCETRGLLCASLPFHESFESESTGDWFPTDSWSFGPSQSGNVSISSSTSHEGRHSLAMSSLRQNYGGINELILSVDLQNSDVLTNAAILEFWWTDSSDLNDKYDSIAIRNSAHPESGWITILELQPEFYTDDVWFPERVDLSLEAARYGISADQNLQIRFGQLGNQPFDLGGILFDDIRISLNGPPSLFSYYYHPAVSKDETWHTSELTCSELYFGGHLVTISTRTENTELRNLCYLATGGDETFSGRCWIGLTDDHPYAEPQEWVWVADLSEVVFVGLFGGEPLKPVHWDNVIVPLQPSSENQNCTIWRNNDHRDDRSLWADQDCTRDRDYLCQKPIEFKYYPFKALWGDAERRCNEDAGHLVSISTDSQNTHVRDACRFRECWIGLTNVINSSTKYSFSDHSTFIVYTAAPNGTNGTAHSYVNWQQGSEHLDSNANGDGCVNLLPDGTWALQNCNTHRSAFVCAIPQDSTPDEVPAPIPAPEISNELCCKPKSPAGCPFGSNCCSDGKWKCNYIDGTTRCQGSFGEICEKEPSVAPAPEPSSVLIQYPSTEITTCPEALINAAPGESILCPIEGPCSHGEVTCCDSTYAEYICFCQQGAFTCEKTDFCANPDC